MAQKRAVQTSFSSTPVECPQFLSTKVSSRRSDDDHLLIFAHSVFYIVKILFLLDYNAELYAVSVVDHFLLAYLLPNMLIQFVCGNNFIYRFVCFICVSNI